MQSKIVHYRCVDVAVLETRKKMCIMKQFFHEVFKAGEVDLIQAVSKTRHPEIRSQMFFRVIITCDQRNIVN